MDAYIINGYRSAVGKSKKGGFRFYRPDDLAADVIKHLVANTPGLEAKMVDDLIVGNAVPEAEQGMQMGRMISLLALGIDNPGFIINRYCGSGLEAIALAVGKIKAGMADCIIAGGTESMSLVPMMGYKTALNWKIASEHPSYYLSMGLTAEELAKEYSITREDSDAFSVRSHERALAAINGGKFKDEIVPVEVEETYLDEKGKKKTRKFVVDTDEGPRAETSMEVLAKLKPAFKNGGQVTAGNSSQTSDGAAFVVVMSERLMKSLNLDPVARMMSYSVAGVDPRIMGIGPKEAVPKALKQAGLSMSDIGLVELNEAFAAQALAVIRSLDMDEELVNVNGGAVALGHPLGCTGAKLSVQLFNEMRRRNSKYGMVTACVGGGQGVAGIYELLK
ncbi:MAG TPA: acetyl-CoA C-acyltransferase [Algoriphagus sp.]|jgi:acetyl-CoA acyltransferase|uniref:acetyl-CoA C-acyltransferase n=1 Tax=Algoriphagus ornithinivorans TaxID=226506 RepID=A0A1I5G0I8_9BACT|nr:MULTISPECIES: acetyl-CoA C-acyltransferase [Algoriphagus]MAL12108.1 acetyl-CoA C-acyltransferase [Algoriphagus sp.]MAN87042.1 acetyl-CoA C-acyltransferase [Algoriphagus sp.]QYH40499.1 acetyl-CoA C-acyltransferase [Algoriphagus sp. NBT04N3]SFO29554.1 acetyl-CoA acyltransferase [Algoriphagus ornithinivorans]HAD50744.1 acetyl-CoA C-acyltransferase [Algoriphagus sp.]